MDEKLADRLFEKVKVRIDYDPMLDDKIKAYIQTGVDEVNTYIDEDTLPPKLEWIVVEIAVAKNVKAGSEGTTSSSEEGLSRAFDTNDLQPFLELLNRYVNNQSKGAGNVLYGGIRGFN